MCIWTLFSKICFFLFLFSFFKILIYLTLFCSLQVPYNCWISFSMSMSENPLNVYCTSVVLLSHYLQSPLLYIFTYFSARFLSSFQFPISHSISLNNKLQLITISNLINTLIVHPPLIYKNINFQQKIVYVSLPIILVVFGAQKNHDWDNSFEYPQHVFWLRNKKIKTSIHKILVHGCHLIF